MESSLGKISADVPMQNIDSYPLKYALLTIKNNDGPILEAGCGAGRILRYFHYKGFDIIGIDFIKVAIEKLRLADKSLKADTGDITKLDFADSSFKYLLAFGLYHNLEHNLVDAISETRRVLQDGGKVCASFRADNIQTRLTDWLTERRSIKKGNKPGSVFHKEI